MTQESQNRTTAMIITVFFHTVILLFLFLFVLHTPLPPFTGGQGVVLNLGYVDEGTGEVQTLNDANDSPITEENKPVDNPVPDQTTEQPEKTPNSTPESDGNILSGEEESEVKTEPKPEKKESKNDKDEVKKPDNEKEKENAVKSNPTPKALFGGQSGTSNKGGNNNGDKEGKTGDQGNPQGDINAKALYGNPGTGGEGAGGSGGASLDLAGWRWERKPKVKDENEDENGKIVFQITIDEQGEIVSIVTVEKTVSPSVEKLYKQEVEKLTFVKTDNNIPAHTSTGKITFIIRAR